MAIRDQIQYPWYQVVAGADFTQGDILKDCPIVVAAPDEALLREPREEEADFDLKIATVIVMTQACDIEQNKVQSIVLCPVFPLDEIARTFTHLGTTKGKDDLRKGHIHSLHLLNGDGDLGLNFLVVDFRELYSLPTDFLRLVAERRGDRPRLLSPYREHLSQSFARYFMRVGLPIDIPAFT